jgi:hypothetical protein
MPMIVHQVVIKLRRVEKDLLLEAAKSTFHNPHPLIYLLNNRAHGAKKGPNIGILLLGKGPWTRRNGEGTLDLQKLEWQGGGTWDAR